MPASPQSHYMLVDCPIEIGSDNLVSFRSMDESLALTSEERDELQSRIRMRSLRAEDHRRARLILLLDAGRSYIEIQEILSCGATYVSRWKQRFIDARISGLFSRHPGRAVQKGRPQLEARILAWTQRKPTDGSTHWSVRKLAQHLGVPKTTVARVWQRAGLKPHRIEQYMTSDDPDFETKAADIIGLYIHPPRHAAVFCVDEKTAIQALDRLDPVLPLSPGRAERHGFEYYRHGTLSLYAALKILQQVKFSAKRPHVTPARNLSRSLATFLLISPAAERSTSLPTTYPLTKPSVSAILSASIPTFAFTTHRRTRHGSIKSKSGSRKSSAM
jgi:transposase